MKQSDDAPTEIPHNISDLTPDWLTNVLRAAGVMAPGRVIALETIPLGESGGLMSRVVRLVPVYDQPGAGGPVSLIAKFPPADAGLQAIGVERGFFEGECGFYQELAEHSAIRAPRCYFTRFDASTGAFFTLLEDCSPGARRGDFTAGCGEGEARAAIEVLARFHASWWNSPSLEEHSWLRRRADELAAGVVRDAWPAFASRFRRAVGEEGLHTLSRVPELLTNSLDRLVDRPYTLLHADFKLDNLFFAASGEVVVIDWGLVANGPPMFDVASFLALNLAVPDRRAWERELIRGYVEVLEGAGVSDYPIDQALTDYGRQLFALLPQLINAGGLASFADDGALDQYAEGLRRVLAALQDNEVIEHLLD